MTFNKNFLRSISLLFVEDDPDIRLLISKVLRQRMGYLILAENGRHGLDMYHEHRPDMVVTDILMPIMSGLNMAKAIRESDRNTPIIITTAYSDEEFFLSAIDLGIDQFVLKPTNPHVLIEAIEKCARVLWHQREQEAANQYVRFLLDAQPNFLMVITNGELEYINRAFLTFLGFSSIDQFERENLDLGQWMLTPQGTPLTNFGDWRQVLTENPKAYPIIYLTSPGSKSKKNAAFAITTNSLLEQNRHLFSFLDITDFEDEKRALEIQAFTDALTGTCNRARLQGVLNAEMQRAQRHHLPLSLILCDIDHFKHVNDTFGHQIGDDVLKQFANLIKDNIRAEDVVARWGGEEFMIVSPQNNLAQTRFLAEKLREIVARYPFPEVKQVTCSFGVSQFDGNEDIRAFTERADRALYLAKTLGRNRVEIAP